MLLEWIVIFWIDDACQKLLQREIYIEMEWYMGNSL